MYIKIFNEKYTYFLDVCYFFPKTWERIYRFMYD